ncbi:MAG: hypothetical protein JSR80_06430 [Verrucomicrobia bacterium]|nr:hypothetical protein [Verrucomicrobiota bacterium]
MKTLVLIAAAFTSSLFATPPAVQESPEHIAVSKDQIIVIEDGLFIAHDGQLFPVSALFCTESGFIAQVRKEGVVLHRKEAKKGHCWKCGKKLLPSGRCGNSECILCGL